GGVSAPRIRQRRMPHRPPASRELGAAVAAEPARAAKRPMAVARQGVLFSAHLRRARGFGQRPSFDAW
ncbi:hypothetical protein ACWD26_43030, partial [Streptomyces sp. NPDC002787]